MTAQPVAQRQQQPPKIISNASPALPSPGLSLKTSKIDHIYAENLPKIVALKNAIISKCSILDTRNNTLDTVEKWPETESLRTELRDIDTEIATLAERVRKITPIADQIKEEISRIKDSTKVSQIPEDIIAAGEEEATQLEISYLHKLKLAEDSIAGGKQMLDLIEQIKRQQTRLWDHSRRHFEQRLHRSESGATRSSSVTWLSDRFARYVTQPTKPADKIGEDGRNPNS